MNERVKKIQGNYKTILQWTSVDNSKPDGSIVYWVYKHTK